MRKLTESKLLELIKSILEQEVDKKNSKVVDKKKPSDDEEKKGSELKMDMSDNPFADEE